MWASLARAIQVSNWSRSDARVLRQSGVSVSTMNVASEPSSSRQITISGTQRAPSPQAAHSCDRAASDRKAKPARHTGARLATGWPSQSIVRVFVP